MLLTLDAKRRLTLPKELVPAQPGDYFEASFDVEDQVVTFRKLPAKADWLKVLKECPVPARLKLGPIRPPILGPAMDWPRPSRV